MKKYELKNSLKWLYAGMFIFLIAIMYIFGNVDETAMAKPNSAYIVIEQSTCRTLKGENIHTRLPMASTTKVMTAYTVIKNVKDLDRKITVDKKAVGIEGSSIYLKEGEKLSFRELLYGLMMRSGNDSAVALAIGTSGSEEEFVKQMNYEAKLLNLHNTNFTNPHGLHNDNHYTSCYDLAVITAEAYKYDAFKEIVCCKNIKIPCYDGGYRYLVNKNKMLYQYKDSNGVKTGFTKKAGRCLVSGAKKNDMQLISVVLNIPDMYNMSGYLLDYGFKNYDMKKINELAGRSKVEIPIENKKEKLTVDLSEIKTPLSEEEKQNASVRLNLPKHLTLPVRKGQKIGNYQIYLDNNMIFQHNVNSNTDIKKGVFSRFVR